VARVKERLNARRKDIQWVGEQWPAFGKLDPVPVSTHSARAAGRDFQRDLRTDLIRFVREGHRGFFKNISVQAG